MPVNVPQRKGDPQLFDTDECPQETSFDRLSKMKPAFKKDGVGTAGNASIISDGASAVVVMSEKKSKGTGMSHPGGNRCPGFLWH